MNDKQKQIIIQWIKNLRSGNYKQGSEFLRYKERGNYYHCCLGVLCSTLKTNWSAMYDKGTKLESSVYIPDGLLEKHELLSIIDGEGYRYNRRSWNVVNEDNDYIFDNLAEFNDRHLSFTMIADIIEARLIKKIRAKLIVCYNYHGTACWSNKSAQLLKKHKVGEQL